MTQLLNTILSHWLINHWLTQLVITIIAASLLTIVANYFLEKSKLIDSRIKKFFIIPVVATSFAVLINFAQYKIFNRINKPIFDLKVFGRYGEKDASGNILFTEDTVTFVVKLTRGVLDSMSVQYPLEGKALRFLDKNPSRGEVLLSLDAGTQG